jgi:hypothetical protein
MLGLPLELIVIVAIGLIGAIVYFGKKMSFPSEGSLPSGVPWKLLFLGGAVLIIVFFAEDIFSFDWNTTSIGRFLEAKIGAGASILLWAIILVIGVIIWQKNSPNKPKHNAFVSGGVGGFIENIVGTAGYAIIIGVVAIGALFGLIILLAIGDVATDGTVQRWIDTGVAVKRGEPLPKRAYNGEECDFKDKLEARNNRIPTEWITITICKDDSTFLFFVPKGTVPEIDYRDRNDRVLTSRPIADFVRIDATYGKPGGMPDLYMLYIPQSPEGLPNGFRSASLGSVTFDIRARR